jgi:hypothetical protein
LVIGAHIRVKIVHIAKKPGMKIPIWPLDKIQKGVEWICCNRAKSTISRCIRGIFENFRGIKGTLDHLSRKF